MKVIKPETAKAAETRSETKPAKRSKKPKPVEPAPEMEGLTARQRAKVLAATKYGTGADANEIPMTPAQKRKQRRDTHVPFTCELPVDQAAKLLALAKANNVTQVAIIRELIDKAKLPR